MQLTLSFKEQGSSLDGQPTPALVISLKFSLSKMCIRKQFIKQLKA